jgi:hypothetical protein
MKYVQTGQLAQLMETRVVIHANGADCIKAPSVVGIGTVVHVFRGQGAVLEDTSELFDRLL